MIPIDSWYWFDAVHLPSRQMFRCVELDHPHKLPEGGKVNKYKEFLPGDFAFLGAETGLHFGVDHADFKSDWRPVGEWMDDEAGRVDIEHNLLRLCERLERLVGQIGADFDDGK